MHRTQSRTVVSHGLLTLAALLGLAMLPASAGAGETPTAGATALAAAPAATPSAAAVLAAAHPPPAELTEDERSLWRTEEAFAASFWARDAERFASFLADDAVFAGRQRMLRGKPEVREVWTRMMLDGPTAPFSWRPTRSMVAGELGSTSGAVYDTTGKWTGSFTSVWRRQPDGSWRVVLDGAPPCGAPAEDAAAAP